MQPSFPVPRSIELQYDQVYNNNGTVTLDTIRQSVAENYQRRPNELDPFGPGPTAAGLQALFSTFGGTFSNFKVFRQKYAVLAYIHFWNVLFSNRMLPGLIDSSPLLWQASKRFLKIQCYHCKTEE